MVKSLYVISDTHDDLEATARAIDYAKSEGRDNSMIIHAGDLSLRPYTRESLDKLERTRDVKTFLDEKRRHNDGILKGYKEIFDASGMGYLVVPGNYDGDLGHIFSERDIHNKSQMFGGIKVAGYGAGGNLDAEWIGPEHMEFLARKGEIKMFNPKELSDLLKTEAPDIAVIHNPPYGFCDDMFNGRHVGTPTTTRYMRQENNLKLVLSGHIHEAGPNGNNPNGVRGLSGIEREDGGKVLVVNPGNLGRFALLSSETLEPVMEFDYGTFVRVDVEDDGSPTKVTQYSVQEDNRSIGQVRKLREIKV